MNPSETKVRRKVLRKYLEKYGEQVKLLRGTIRPDGVGGWTQDEPEEVGYQLFRRRLKDAVAPAPSVDVEVGLLSRFDLVMVGEYDADVKMDDTFDEYRVEYVAASLIRTIVGCRLK